MPPLPLEYHDLDAVARFYASVIRQGRIYDLVPTRANGQLAFGPTCVPPRAAFVTGPAFSSSPSLATGSPD